MEWEFPDREKGYTAQVISLLASSLIPRISGIDAKKLASTATKNFFAQRLDTGIFNASWGINRF